MSTESVRGKTTVIHFNGERCVHSRNCVLDRPDVFVPNVQGEWIHPDRATPGEVAALALNCPSGAIRYENVDGSPAERPPLVNTVRMRGNLEVVSGTGHTVNRGTETWLCRCGHSGNKPYCDGSHKKAGFRSD